MNYHANSIIYDGWDLSTENFFCEKRMYQKVIDFVENNNCKIHQILFITSRFSKTTQIIQINLKKARIYIIL